MALKPLHGYPTSIGNKLLSVFPHVGPTSYTQITAAAGTVPVTGGDTVNTVEAGLKYFDQVLEGVTDDGCFLVRAIPVQPSTPAIGAPEKSFALQWIALVTATIGGQAQTAGSEAVATTNLSSETVRLTAIGPN